MNQENSRKDFPDFFSERGELPITVTPVHFGNSIYWMSSLVSKDVDNSVNNSHLKPYDDNDVDLVNCEDMDEHYDITLTKSGKFTTSFYVPSSLLAYIIGAKAVRLKNLERTTNTQIKVPKPNEKGNVTITGDTERKVASARTQISIIVTQRKDKLPISHFVSIPVSSNEIRMKLNEFKTVVLKDPSRGVAESLFQNPEKLHLTISTLTLVDEEEISTAKEVLQNCYKDCISKLFKKENRYRIHLKGLEIMNDDPSSVNVLYCNVFMDKNDENEKLQTISDTIAEYYSKSGLAKKQYDRVKLHVTLMNTSFRHPEERQESFDAVDILKKFKDFYFGSVDFQNIHLSIRFTGKGKYYEAESIVNITN
ncbi:unnamed protein product [Phyllotreta striolata]|uniref:K Homology domain-containing protein n=1 Tax=Phyllotreta striolata TaxID=444603 RepID=A0A9N9TRR1_PHYSR|nr:unnamed protein product [Phyllotreta striolata]